MSEKESVFLQLVSLGIGNSVNRSIPKRIDWEEVEALAEKQGLSAIIVDGIERLPEEQRPPKEELLQLIGTVLQGCDYRYHFYKEAISDLAGFFNKHGLRMMILKGYACSLNWPKPEHRPCGDIDIWQFGEYKKADALLEAEKPVQVVQGGQEFKVDRSHHHHTVYNWRDFMVENHYDFINVYHHKSNVGLEKEFKRLGSEANLNENDNHNSVGNRIMSVEVFGEKVYLPSPNLHALFLLKHTMNDFTSFSMTLRQVLDWAFHVEKHGKEIDWEWLLGILERYHMMDFFNCLNAICVEDLGFDASIFHKVLFNPSVKNKVLEDILNPAFTSAEPKRLVPRLIYKLQRWQGNAWKHELCYKESLWSAFWSGVWSHLLKPSSI